MDVKEYLQNPCGTLSIPYWKAKTLAIPDSMRIIHCSNWNGQYGNFQRFFRIKHDLNDLSPIDYDYDTLSIDYQATQLCEMINESYKHENIVVSEQDILQWKQHKTFREELCVYINADNIKISQVLYNLINNAINYTGEDNTVTVRQKINGNMVRIEISDTGDGIDEENIKFIWDRYYKVDKTHKRPVSGTGIGLSIVKNILELHGFKYGVMSKKGEGSTFYFEAERI